MLDKLSIKALCSEWNLQVTSHTPKTEYNVGKYLLVTEDSSTKVSIEYGFDGGDWLLFIMENGNKVPFDNGTHSGGLRQAIKNADMVLAKLNTK